MKAKIIENKPVANQKLSKTHLLKEYAGEVLFFFFSKFLALPLILKLSIRTEPYTN